MAKLSPAEAAEKYATRMKAAVPDVTKGVQRVTEAPGAKAAAKKDKMRANLMAAIDNGKWERRVAAVSLGEWKEKMINKGVGRIAAGVDAATGDMATFYGELFPYQDNLKATLSGMPDVSIEDSVNRASFWIREMHKFERTR